MDKLLNVMLVRFRGKAVAVCNGYGALLSSYNFGSQYLYSSISTHTNYLEKYLVDSLGFSNEEAASTSSKVTSPKPSKNADLVINLLKQTGFDNTQMKNMVSKVPKLLYCDVSKTLKPKFPYLMDLGLSGSELVDVIVKDTKIVDRGLDTHMRPTIDCLRRILGSDENVVKAIKRAPWLLSFGAHRNMENNVSLLRNFGFSDEKIRRFVLIYPNYLTLKPEKIKDLLHIVENDFQVPRDSPIFQYGFRVLSSQKKSMLDRKIGIFKSFGWSVDEILEMFWKQPYYLSLSEVRIEKKLNLFMKELGFESAFLVSHPLFMYSLEKRVVPRVQVLKILDEKKLQRRELPLYRVFQLTEPKFIEYFVLPYKDKIPHLYEPLKKIVLPWLILFTFGTEIFLKLSVLVEYILLLSFQIVSLIERPLSYYKSELL